MNDLTSEEKNRLRALIESDDWALVMTVHADMLERARSFCEEKPAAEVAKWQGVALGLREFVKALEDRARPITPLQELGSPSAHFRNSFGRSASGGY